MGFCNYRTGTAAELNRELLQLDFETTRGCSLMSTVGLCIRLKIRHFSNNSNKNVFVQERHVFILSPYEWP